MMVLILCISAVVSYLLGGLNGAIILSKLVYKQDIREFGSNNRSSVFGLVLYDRPLLPHMV